MVERFIVATKTGEEIGYASEIKAADFEIGENNNFEISLNTEDFSLSKYGIGNRIFLPFTEIGGFIEDIETLSKSEVVKLRGKTWRGLLERKIVEPPDGQSHLILNGELNEVIRSLIGSQFENLIHVPSAGVGEVLRGYQVDRYESLYDVLSKMLEQRNLTLGIEYTEPEGWEDGYITIEPRRIRDMSEILEFSKESDIELKSRDCRSGINHLICLGKGRNEERIVRHLYIKKDGTVGQEKEFFGLDERVATYDLTNADIEKLEEDSLKKIKELQDYTKMEISARDMDFNLGDIIRGYDEITRVTAIQRVVGIVVKFDGEELTKEYKIQGGSKWANLKA